MELKEIIQIIIHKKTLFFTTFLIVIFITIGWLLFQPQEYQTSMAVDITRDSNNATTDYQYDQYYRLLADEKFADTIVQWTKDPQLVKEIFDSASVKTKAESLRSFSGLINGEKLSSNFVQIKLSTQNKEDAERLARAVNEIFSAKIKKINESAQDKNWFKLNFSRAIIVEHRPSFILVLLLGVAGGMILAVFTVMVHYYWKEGKLDDQQFENVK